jgi:hypothetical protein
MDEPHWTRSQWTVVIIACAITLFAFVYSLAHLSEHAG